VILTVVTPEVAACAGDGEARGTRMEMVEGLLFNRVNSKSAGLAVNFADKHAVMVAATTTTSRLSIGNVTVMRTELAHHYTILSRLIIFALVKVHVQCFMFNASCSTISPYIQYYGMTPLGKGYGKGYE
jgi:hypothetical protein